MSSLNQKININILIMLLIMGFSACAGRNPNPTPIVRPGDDTLSCQYVASEMAELEAKVQRLLPASQKTGKNVALGVTGAFLIVPLFFMDFSEAERIEVESYQARYNHLARLYNSKRCSGTNVPEMALVTRDYQETK